MRDDANKSFIEMTILRIKDMAILYDRFLNQGNNEQAAKALNECHKAQNDLYDAIGEMDEYKFDLRED